MCDKNEWLLFSSLAAVWTHVFTCAQLVSYFHILFNILTRDVWLRMDGCCSLHFVLCELMHSLVLVQQVSYFHIWLHFNTRCVIKHEWLLFFPLVAVWTHAFTCSQRVSYFHTWLTFWHEMCDLEWMIALLSTCCCVNSCNNLCSVGKLLSHLVNILTKHLRMNGCSSLLSLLCELMHSLVLSK